MNLLSFFPFVTIFMYMYMHLYLHLHMSFLYVYITFVRVYSVRYLCLKVICTLVLLISSAFRK